MDQENGRSGWYDTADGRQRFENYPNRLTADVQAPPTKKKHTGVKVTMIIVCVLVLIAATAFAFAPRGGQNDSLEAPPDGSQATASDVPDFSKLPGIYGGDDSQDYDDFRDYFNNYFTEDTIQPSSIERAETGTGVTLSLTSSAGLEEMTLAELYKSAIDSIVGVTATSDSITGYYSGTGIIMTADGYILTNAHVISGTDECTVTTSDGAEYDARLVGEDTQSDIAVLKIEASGLKAAQFGISDELSIGDSVAAIGNPLGDELKGTMTNGIVSAMNRSITYRNHTMTLIQTNAALNEGNSGGPLFNMYGQVVGITNMKLSAAATETSIEGIGFAIPTSGAKAVIDQLIAEGEVKGRPGIGITCGTVSQEAMQRYDLPEGLYISKVEKRSDAYMQGIREGDILTAVNGKSVMTVDDVNAIKDGLTVGDTLTMTIYRDGADFGGSYKTAHTVRTNCPDVYCTLANNVTTGDVTQWTKVGTAAEDGTLVVDTSTLAPGEYIFAIPGQYGNEYTDAIVGAPGGIRLTIHEKPVVKGDMNGDGVIDTFDVTELFNAISSDKELDIALADINGDGVVNAFDVTALYALIQSGN